jgi:hypothetical protein
MLNHTKSKIPKREALQFLSSGQSVSNPIAIVAVMSLIFSSLSFLLQVFNYGATSTLARKKPPSLVQIADGNTINVKALEPDDRSAEVIKKFVVDTLVKIFNWDGLIRLNKNGEIITQQDNGISIKVNKGTARVTTKAWEAAFALSEEQDFRSSFLKKLAELTPPSVFQGGLQSSLVPRYVSEPRKIGQGKWQIDVIATLVTFSKDDNAGNGIAFNKTVTVQAIQSPQKPPETTEIAHKIYSVRRSGLEIIEITDLNLGKN